MKICVSAFVLTLLTLAATSAISRASVIDQMSFEDVAAGADLVVLGQVVQSPALGFYDPATRNVYRHHRVRVTTHLKGTGATEITVLTLGGQFDTTGLGISGPKIQEMEYGGAPQLPSVGQKVLLFLKTWSEGYIIYFASHGVITVHEGTKGGDDWVYLVFRDPRIMTTAALKAYDEMKASGTSSQNQLYTDRVPTLALKQLVERALSLKGTPGKR